MATSLKFAPLRAPRPTLVRGRRSFVCRAEADMQTPSLSKTPEWVPEQAGPILKFLESNDVKLITERPRPQLLHLTLGTGTGTEPPLVQPNFTSIQLTDPTPDSRLHPPAQAVPVPWLSTGLCPPASLASQSGPVPQPHPARQLTTELLLSAHPDPLDLPLGLSSPPLSPSHSAPLPTLPVSQSAAGPLGSRTPPFQSPPRRQGGGYLATCSAPPHLTGTSAAWAPAVNSQAGFPYGRDGQMGSSRQQMVYDTGRGGGRWQGTERKPGGCAGTRAGVGICSADGCQHGAVPLGLRQRLIGAVGEDVVGAISAAAAEAGLVLPPLGTFVRNPGITQNQDHADGSWAAVAPLEPHAVAWGSDGAWGSSTTSPASTGTSGSSSSERSRSRSSSGVDSLLMRAWGRHGGYRREIAARWGRSCEAQPAAGTAAVASAAGAHTVGVDSADPHSPGLGTSSLQGGRAAAGAQQHLASIWFQEAAVTGFFQRPPPVGGCRAHAGPHRGSGGGACGTCSSSSVGSRSRSSSNWSGSSSSYHGKCSGPRGVRLPAQRPAAARFQPPAIERSLSQQVSEHVGMAGASQVTGTGTGTSEATWEQLTLLQTLQGAADVSELLRLMELYDTAFGPNHVVIAFEVLADLVLGRRKQERPRDRAPHRGHEQGSRSAGGRDLGASADAAGTSVAMHSVGTELGAVQEVARRLLDLSTPLVEGGRATPDMLLALVVHPRRLGLAISSEEMLLHVTRLLPYVTRMAPEQLLQLLETLMSHDMRDVAPSSGTAGRVLLLRAHRALTYALPYISIRHVARVLGAMAALAPAGITGFWEAQAQHSASAEWRTDWTAPQPHPKACCEAEASSGVTVRDGKRMYGYRLGSRSGSGSGLGSGCGGTSSTDCNPGAATATEGSPRAVGAAAGATVVQATQTCGGGGIGSGGGGGAPRLLGRRLDAAFAAAATSRIRAALACGDLGPEDAVQLLHGIARFREWPGRAGLARLQALQGRPGSQAVDWTRPGDPLLHPLAVPVLAAAASRTVSGGGQKASAAVAATASAVAKQLESDGRSNARPAAALTTLAPFLSLPEGTWSPGAWAGVGAGAGVVTMTGTSAPAVLVQPIRRAVERYAIAGSVMRGGTMDPPTLGSAIDTASRPVGRSAVDPDTAVLLALIDLVPTPPQVQPPPLQPPSTVSPPRTTTASTPSPPGPANGPSPTCSFQAPPSSPAALPADRWLLGFGVQPGPMLYAGVESQPSAAAPSSPKSVSASFESPASSPVSGAAASVRHATGCGAVTPAASTSAATPAGSGQTWRRSMSPQQLLPQPQPPEETPAETGTSPNITHVLAFDIVPYCTALWSLVRLGVRPNPLWVAGFMAAVQPCLAQMDPGLLARVWWALCKVRWAPTPAWRAALMDAVAAKVPVLQPDEVCMILGGFGMRCYRPQRTWMEPLLEQVKATLLNFHATSSVALAVALARMDYRPRHSFLKPFLEHCRMQLPYMDGRHLVNLLWALRHAGLQRQLGPLWRSAYLDAALDLLLLGQRQQQQPKEQERQMKTPGKLQQQRPLGVPDMPAMSAGSHRDLGRSDDCSTTAAAAAIAASASAPAPTAATATATPGPLAATGAVAPAPAHVAAVAGASPRRPRAGPLTPPQLALLLLYVARVEMSPGWRWRRTFWAVSLASLPYMPPVALAAVLNGVRRLQVAPPLEWARAFFAASAARMELCSASCLVQLASSLLRSPLRPSGTWVRAFRNRLEGVMSSLSRHQVGICMQMIRYVSWRRRWRLPRGWQMDTPEGTLYDSSAAGAAAATAGRRQRGRRWWLRLLGVRPVTERLRPWRGVPGGAHPTTRVSVLLLTVKRDEAISSAVNGMGVSHSPPSSLTVGLQGMPAGAATAMAIAADDSLISDSGAEALRPGGEGGNRVGCTRSGSAGGKGGGGGNSRHRRRGSMRGAASGRKLGDNISSGSSISCSDSSIKRGGGV